MKKGKTMDPLRIGTRSFSRISGVLVLLLLTCGLSATKYAGEIFRLGAGVRQYGLGGCGVVDPDNAALAYWNPALLTISGEKRVELMHAEDFAGDLKYDIITGHLGENGRMAFTLSRIGIDGISLTKKLHPDEPLSEENPPVEDKNVNNADYLLQVGFVQSVAGLPVGIAPKIAWRSLADESGWGFGLDVSTWFDLTSRWRMGMRLHDLSTVIVWDNGTQEQAMPGLDLESSLKFTFPILECPSTLFMGVDVMSEGREESATVAFDPFSLDFRAGLDLAIHDYISLRGGFDVENPTAGIGLHYQNYSLDYGMKQTTDLEDSHRVSIGMKFD